MQAETPEKFHPAQCHRFLLRFISIVFCNKCYMSVGNVQYPLIGDGYHVGVLTQIFDYMF